MTLFSSIKTNNPFIDTFLSTILFTTITYFIPLIYNNIGKHFFYYHVWLLFDNMKSLFYKKYSVSFEGKQTYAISRFDAIPNISSCFTDTFKALFHDIINNIEINNSIYDIQEYITSKKYFHEQIDSDMYIIKQKTPVLYNKNLNIYMVANIEKEESKQSSKTTMRTETITITLYSYTTDIKGILKFIEEIKEKYLHFVEESRMDKKFIYSLKMAKQDEDGVKQCWNEHLFESARTFKNMFFENKEDVLSKINFFLNNKEWYYNNGIPYTLGIGLHGPPGTGKTSFFKSLANLTGRHLVILSLKTIKTKQQLDEFFFETKYNKKNAVGFDKKLMIIEDIDCMSDVVFKRETRNKKHKSEMNLSNISNTIQLQQLIETDDDKKTEEKRMFDTLNKCLKNDDPVTLDDILNLFDGIKETPGRILGISSNHYDKLDPALTRPGRIDISIRLDNCKRSTIQEMYEHYYKLHIEPNHLKKIREFFYSPAEIINCYVLYKTEPDKFIERLIKNKKFV